MKNGLAARLPPRDAQRLWGGSTPILRSLGTVAFILSLLAFLTFISPTRSYAQSNSGIIQGTVTDPSKAVVPGAKVRVENPISGQVSEMETGMDGTFSIP